jgi:hypothetical protein
MEQKIFPAMVRLRPRLRQIERKLRSAGVCHVSREDLEQDTLLRIFENLKAVPDAVETIREPEGYVWRAATRRVQEIRRGRGVRRVRHRVETVFRCRQDELDRWISRQRSVGGLKVWGRPPEVTIFEHWDVVIKSFRDLQFRIGKKICGEIVEKAIFGLFQHTGNPVRLADIAFILASHLDELEPVLISGSEQFDEKSETTVFPPALTPLVDDSLARKAEIRFIVAQLANEPLKRRMTVLKRLDLLEMVECGLVTRDQMAELLGIKTKELTSWLFDWARTGDSELDDLFASGRHPERILWKVRRKLRKLLSPFFFVGMLACICHLNKV